MARAPGGARRRGGGGRRRGAAGGGEGLRKGPWMAEEDQVLLEHVRTHGPCNWSSIQSKGLLPRTGKSCRLRWVNKLRPNLKTGCKFSAEEERVVLELQAQFGNKWARIATYLPGRTDNDVKNFWSTRQKRLARLLRTPLPGGRSSRSRSGKAPAASSVESRPAAAGPCLDLVPLESSSSGVHPCSAALPFLDAHNAPRIPYDHIGSGHLGFHGAAPPTAPATDSRAGSSNTAPLPPLVPFDQPPYPLLEFPAGMPEAWNVAPGFVSAGAMDDLAYQELLPLMQPAPMIQPFFGANYLQSGIKTEPLDAPTDFFGDLPPDMFESLDPLPPPPSSPPASSSGF